jgi:hypothetical protein
MSVANLRDGDFRKEAIKYVNFSLSLGIRDVIQ